MKQTFLASALAGAVVAFLAAPVHGQTAAQKKTAAAPKASAIPRTADGHPDLSGVYSNASAVPLARPADLGAKEFYTSVEEKAQLDAARAAATRGGGRGGRGGGAAANIDPETGQPALQLHYDNTQFGLAGGQKLNAPSLRTSILSGPEGKLPAMTPEATKRTAERRAYAAAHQWDGPDSRPLAERCILWGAEGPPMLPEGYNSDLQIVQGPNGTVSIMQEMIHDARVIPADNSPHIPAAIKQWFGDSRGHWEGDTFIVETTNFTDKTTLQNAATSDKLKVIEKFTRIDANTVKYEFTVDDPETWVKPWSGEVAMTKIDSPIYEYACHEGNYGMANNLSGQRAIEKKK
ncbi:MAG TPA: hypothetical protein VGN17_06305 [Bryobacteraceae bacterium]